MLTFVDTDTHTPEIETKHLSVSNVEEMQYLNIVRDVLENGVQRGDRTGTGTKERRSKKINARVPPDICLHTFLICPTDVYVQAPCPNSDIAHAIHSAMDDFHFSPQSACFGKALSKSCFGSCVAQRTLVSSTKNKSRSVIEVNGLI
jgi:hypothetical protein